MAQRVQRIWKYELKVQDRVVLRMPKGARVLCVQMQRSVVCLWAIVDEDIRNEMRYETRVFRVVGTGHPLDIDSKSTYIGTVQDGDLVWHVFEGTKI